MKKNNPLKWIQVAIGVVLAASYILAIYLIINANLIPIRYLVLAVPASLIVILLVVIANLKSSKSSISKRIGAIIVSLLLIALNIYASLISNSTTSFLSKIQDTGYTSIQYSIIAKSDQHINLASSTKQHMGIIKTDINNDLVKNEVDNKTKVAYVDYNELTSTTVALDDKAVNMAVINDSYLQLLKENDITFYKSIEVLSTFTIKVKNSVSNAKVDTTKPFILYISGIDTYGDISTVSRSDVNILATINPQTHKILLVNTPRDYYVQLHGTTGLKDKLTHSGIYGIDMSLNTMQDLYNISISYYLRINFSSLTKIIDTIGGVDVNSEYKFTAGVYSFNVGINHLNGDQALAFSRERHSFEGGDQTRGSNQELVIEAIITKMHDPHTIANYQQILTSLSGVMQTNMSTSDISKIINTQLDDLSRWNVKSISVTGTSSNNYTYSMGNTLLYVMEPDMASVSNAGQEIQQYLQL